jgi:hypothetical protein
MKPLERPFVRPLLVVLLVALAWTLMTGDAAIR